MCAGELTVFVCLVGGCMAGCCGSFYGCVSEIVVGIYVFMTSQCPLPAAFPPTTAGSWCRRGVLRLSEAGPLAP